LTPGWLGCFLKEKQMKKTATGTVRVHVRLDRKTRARLASAAKALGLSRAAVVRIAVEGIIYATDDDYGPLYPKRKEDER